jgi:ribosomal-protein-alanine N-acetyltransferase
MHLEDIEKVVSLQRECQLADWSADDYQKHIESRNSISLVLARADESIAGFLIARIIEIEAACEILNIAVSENERRHGNARRLLNEIFRVSRLRLKAVHLELRASNAGALAFYRQYGFTETGKRPNYYSNPLEDAIMMTYAVAGA